MSAADKQNESLAEESDKTKKVRRKLLEHYSQIDEKITQQALSRKISEIHRWISRHAVQRVSLSLKTISLFDENQHAAKASQKIAYLSMQLKEQTDKLYSIQNIAETEKSPG